MNKKGFTLVELLAVIVILAVVMLVAVTAVGPLMARARKNSLGSEGLALIKAVIGRYNEEVLKGADAEYKSNDSVCYNLKYLCENGYFEKGCGDDGYNGSVLVKYNNGSYEYYFWISNGTYVFNAATEDNYGNIDDSIIVYEGAEASLDCGKTTPDSVPSDVKSDITNNNNTIINGMTSMIIYEEITTGGNTTWEPIIIRINPVLINFSIGGSTYQAEDGMTWSEWVNSSYNTGSYTVIETSNIGYFRNSKSGVRVLMNSSNVQKDDYIVSNFNYTINNFVSRAS